MLNLSIAGAGLVAPAGTYSATGTLPEGEILITVDSVDPENGYDEAGAPVPSDHQMARCVYPDGFVKNHQFTDKADLLGKIANQMKGRFGMTQVAFAAVPEELAPGATITVEK